MKLKRVDAREWLKVTHGIIRPCESYHESLEMVEQFYALGATKVEVEQYFKDPDDIPDALFVTLSFPIQKPLFNYLISFFPDEFDEVENNFYRLWWD